jgi:hypothetical protein
VSCLSPPVLIVHCRAEGYSEPSVSSVASLTLAAFTGRLSRAPKDIASVTQGVMVKPRERGP